MNVSEKPLPKLKKRTSSKQSQQLRNVVVGRKGEATAKNFLLKLGYEVLDMNFRAGHHEVDIVVKDPKTHELVFVEVKTRSSSDFGDPSLAVSYQKKRAQWRAAAAYYHLHKKYDSDYRFDVIAISPNSIQHFKNVTW